MKKILSIALVVVLLAGIAVSGTMAYLQDTDSDVNVMTLGNVDIEQIEEQLAADGASKEPFVQGKDFYPGTEISKIVSVKNTGKSDAYFRTLIAFEDIPDSETFDISFGFTDTAYTIVPWGGKPVAIEIDGVSYVVYEFIHKTALPAGEISDSSLYEVNMANTATNEDMEALGDTYDILVLSQAVQTAGFDKAETALDTAFGDVNVENCTKWFGGDEFTAPTAVATADELTAALEAGESVYLTADITLDEAVIVDKDADINLNGWKLTTKGLELKSGADIENGTITSGDHTNGIPHLKVSDGKLTMDNVTVDIQHNFNYQDNGAKNYAEVTGLEIANTSAVLNDCIIKVKNDTYCTWSYVYGITMNNGTVAMNGGSISVESAGAQSTNLKTAVCAMNTSTATLKNVTVEAETVGTTMGHLVLNTTDTTVTDADFVSYGGTYELNYIN